MHLSANSPSVRVFIASSLDGFIAGPDNDLSWLDPNKYAAFNNPPDQQKGLLPLSYENFKEDIGSILMGRTTFDVVRGFDIPWPYGETPVMVATSRHLESDIKTVFPVQGNISNMIKKAQEKAGEKDVYLDGGNLIRQALEADLVDHMVVTFIPILLGKGHPLFAGLEKQIPLHFESAAVFEKSLLQISIDLRNS